ncbi:response regulator transcription factor [Pedobacter sp. KBW06]|uniref:response regulator transcription factor n=1 Tax=Pedobacter sp. KBW06 TaxID=2153359 RepID=UPI0018F77796|nr:helix-turn-helix transcriptional regulator [Pedobacter sp. KBW06]
MMLPYLICFCYSCPDDKRRFWYLYWCLLMIGGNLIVGFFADSDLGTSKIILNLVYGSGFLLSSYIPVALAQRQHTVERRIHVIYGLLLLSMLLSLFAYWLDFASWVWVFLGNGGFVLTMLGLMVTEVSRSRSDYKKADVLFSQPASCFQKSCLRFQLTRREIEIAELLCQGRTYKEIGSLLFISPKTVDAHAHNIFGKTGVKKRMELVRVLGYAST